MLINDIIAITFALKKSILAIIIEYLKYESFIKLNIYLLHFNGFRISLIHTKLRKIIEILRKTRFLLKMYYNYVVIIF